ncbi:hypothetical protein HHK36_032953 [Tetracentron sinense]|uniref:Dirigent protein n=1 Tax=Tetracentron sinense TaxID=13715 RepID=A0A835CX56_TETSI|nr:hypothetical protein HHK36_032953 [Tetracentron sinense]
MPYRSILGMDILAIESCKILVEGEKSDEIGTLSPQNENIDLGDNLTLNKAAKIVNAAYVEMHFDSIEEVNEYFEEYGRYNGFQFDSISYIAMAGSSWVSIAAKLGLLLLNLAVVVIVSEAKGRKLKETNMVFYMHDYETGNNITTIAVAGNPKKKWGILEFGTAYNGSTLEIQGADLFFLKYREVSVVSGTGKFRFARGYALLDTAFIDIPNSNAIVRWNLTVLHY